MELPKLDVFKNRTAHRKKKVTFAYFNKLN